MKKVENDIQIEEHESIDEDSIWNSVKQRTDVKSVLKMKEEENQIEPEDLNSSYENWQKELEVCETHKKTKPVFEVDEYVSLLAEKVELDLDKILG